MVTAVDLHVHSIKSDGSFTPTALVDYALEKGLSAFALTDHDTIDGLDEAITYAKDKDIEVIPGIEFSTPRVVRHHVAADGDANVKRVDVLVHAGVVLDIHTIPPIHFAVDKGKRSTFYNVFPPKIQSYPPNTTTLYCR